MKFFQLSFRQFTLFTDILIYMEDEILFASSIPHHLYTHLYNKILLTRFMCVCVCVYIVIMKENSKDLELIHQLV